MTNSAFTSDDRLQLLQLTAKREVLERRAAEGVVADGSRAGGMSGQPAPDVLPPCWRLTPASEPLHEWQREALELWSRTHRGTVKVATGGGKTRFALAAAEALQALQSDLRVVIVVPTIPLLFQWQDELHQSNLPPSAIGLMGGDQETPPLEQLRILVCVLASARDRLPALVHKASWPSRMLLIVDECHRANAEQAQRIFDSAPAYTLGLSATPEEADDESDFPSADAYAQSAVGRGLGPIFFEFTLRQSLEAGLLSPFEIWHVGVPLSDDEAARHAKLSREITDLRKQLEAVHSRSRSRQSFIAWCQTMASRGSAQASDAQRFIGLTGERKRLLYRAEARRAITMHVLQEGLGDADSKSILFHESIREIEDLFLDALERGLPVVLEHSQLPDRLRAESIEAFRTGVARAVISAKSLVEGFNVPSADLGIIVASSGSIRQRIQSLGRMLRRKDAGRAARVWVFYVRGTEDEFIYQRADWDHVVGASVNRYFHWMPADEGEPQLLEVNDPPRRYRPASRDVDVATLKIRGEYPGRDDGRDLKIDQQGNARWKDGDDLVALGPEQRESVLELNRYRIAHVTRAGHLIVRRSDATETESAWLYLGTASHAAAPPNTSDAKREELKLVSRSGRRRIARVDGKEERYPSGPAETVNALLSWIAVQETARPGMKVTRLCWDGAAGYWVEWEGERLDFPGTAQALEF